MNYVHYNKERYYQTSPRVLIKGTQNYYIKGGRYYKTNGEYKFHGKTEFIPITEKDASKKGDTFVRRKLYENKMKIFAEQTDRSIAKVKKDIKMINNDSARRKYFNQKISRKDAMVRMGYDDSDMWNYIRSHDLEEKINYPKNRKLYGDDVE